MNSLIMLPIQDDSASPVRYNLTIENSTFNHFSGCGSILSNYNSTQFYINKTTYLPSFLNFTYQKYPYHLQGSANTVLTRHYQSYQRINQSAGAQLVSAFSRFNANMNFIKQIRIRGNTFSNLNQLKKRHTDQAQDRVLSRGSLPRVQNETMRDLGLAVQLMDNFDSSYIAIENNQFIDIQQEFVVDMGSAGQCHCNSVSNSLGATSSQDILSNGTDMIVQLAHVISIKQMRNTLVIIANSSFSNITLSGPIIHIQERQGMATSPIVIARNNFTMIQGQINSNVITIMRDTTDQAYHDGLQDLTPSGESLASNEKDKLSNVIFGGSIVISQNRFNFITGCSEVDAGVLFIGVKYDQTFLSQPESYRRNHLLLQKNPQERLFTAYSGKDQLYFKNPVINVPSAGGIIVYNRSGVNISGNEYVNVSMGAQRNQDGMNIVGALIKVVNAISVQISGESYVNIGAYTSELSNYLFDKILYKTTSKQQSKDLFNSQQIYGGVSSFFGTYLSQTLISVETTTFVLLGGSNYFENIWLIDRVDALSRNQNMGIILRVDYLIGSIEIGSSVGDPSKILNIVGYLNSQTLDAPWYQFDPSKSLISDKYAQYGAGAPLFHIHSANNQISQVSFSNMILQNLLFTANKTYPDGDTAKVPAIFTTDFQDKNFNKVPLLVTISEVKFFDIQLDGVFQYFNLLARLIQVNWLAVTGIGSFDISANEPRLSAIVTRDRVGEVQLEENVCFMKLNLFSKIGEENVAFVSQAIFNHLKFSQINLRKAGLPIFMIDRSYDQAPSLITYVNVTNMLINGQYFDEDKASKWEYIPDSYLFTVQNSKPINLQLNFYSATLGLLYSKCKLL
ncbi:hypothetical protein FGO68_gene10718 [Halteria grandinella]|uniref:Uncharacterized protein n=1 Tax=Halteria grandinella TaxID=5974 RepID=A0A8J8TB83_HALGN|nr:hypothetical protein FGO68_gene10718 [Halteria grandinella]